MQCNLVSPIWVQLGRIKWAGGKGEEKLFYIERKQCTGTVEKSFIKNGIKFCLCPEHVAEVEAGKLFNFI